MKNKRLIRLLKCFNEADFLSLRKAFQSPIFAVSHQHLVFYDLLRPHYPDFDSQELLPEKIFTALYPEASFDSGKLRTFMSRFTKVVEEYLMLVKLRKDDFGRKKLLVDIFGKDGEHEFFRKSAYQLLEELEEREGQDLDYFREKLMLSWDLFYHPNTLKLQEENVTLDSINTSLDLFFILAKIQIACDLMTQERIQRESSSISFLEKIEEKMEELYAEDYPAVKFFLQILRLKKGGKEEDFNLAKLALVEESDRLTKLEKEFALFHLLNFSVGKGFLGKSEYTKSGLELYKFGLVNGLLVKDGKMTSRSFMNIVAFSCLEKEFVWAEEFIEGYKQYLDPDTSQDAETFSLAYLAFFRKDFSTAIDLINNYRFIRITDVCRGDFLLLRSYFEYAILDGTYFKKFIDFSNAWEKKLKRDVQLSNGKKESYLNSINIIRKLGKAINKNKMDKRKFLNLLKDKELIVGKVWIEDRINQIK